MIDRRTLGILNIFSQIANPRVQAMISGDTLLWDNRQANNRTRSAGPAYSRLIGYTWIYSANIVPAQEQLIQRTSWSLFVEIRQ